jgi:hypothetical protein
MKQHVCLSAICLCVLQATAAQEIATQHTPLEKFIGDAANKYDVYFTIEGACPSNVFDSLVLIEDVATRSVPADINAVISAVTNSITNMIAVHEESNKKIYHIIDRRLFRMDDYPMGMVMESIEFEGDGGSFVNHIGATFTNVVNQEGIDLIESFNEETTIAIDKVRVSVRDALSDGVDLHGYNRIIWTAFTPLETHRTYVHFIGPLIDMERFKSGNTTNHGATNKP